MTGNRPILPRIAPSDDLNAADASIPGISRPGRRKIERISHACEVCRRKKVKCDGLRPVCSPCSLRKVSCEYVSPSGQSKLDIANSRLEAFTALFAALKNGSPQQRDALLQHIQSTDDILSLAQLDINETKMNSTERTSELFRPGHRDDSLSSSELTVDVGTTILSRGHTHTPEKSLLWKLDAPEADTTRAAVDFFFECSSRLFHVFPPETINTHFVRMFDQGDFHSVEGMTATACVSAVAAVGCQYSNGDFDQATETAFYNASRHYLETVVHHSPLDAIGVCTLLAMYNVMGKSTVALTYVEMGLSMARMQGLYEKKCPHDNISPVKWIEYRKIWRALIFFSSWLGATLGYVSGNDTLFGVQMSELDVENSQDPEDIVQTELTKISLLKVTVVRLLVAFKDISELTAESILDDLSKWHNQLPPQMHLANIRSANISIGLRRTIYYTHLLHLGAIILVYRLIAYKAQRLSLFNQNREDAVSSRFDRFANHGVMAAKQSAHILEQLMADNGVFRRCWLVMFQSYTSCLAILHTVVQEQLHGVRRSAWEDTLQLALKCITVLEHCGKMDAVAAKFHQTLTDYYDRVARFQDSEARDVTFVEAHAETRAQPSPNFDGSGAFLLHIPTHRDPQQVALAKELLRMLCVPFGDTEARSFSEKLAQTPGWRPDPTCYEHPQLIEQLDCELEKEVRLFNMGADSMIERYRNAQARPDAARFLGNPEPHGWSFRGYPATYDMI